MDELLAISLQSMQADMARLDQVGMNLANVLTPGYKRGVAVQGPLTANFASQLASAGQVQSQPPVAPVQFAADMRAGTLKSTGQGLDVAIAGKGYFEVMTESGPAYTREGGFRIDARGRLVTAQGHPVMGAAGEITLPDARATIAPNGAITFASGQPLGQLKLVEFEVGASPQRLGNGLFAATTGMKPVADEEVQVRQGFLENSNATSTLEMTGLVQAMRHFEGMQKVLQGYDEMLGLAVRKLSENP